MAAGSSGELVSAVIASYNMAQYLPQAVNSVLAQTYANVEVQIVDDGSTDATAAVVRQWDSDPRVRVHFQKNAGAANAKNQGMKLSRGAYVALLDADDVWLPDKLALQMPLFTASPDIGLVYSDYARMDGEGRPLPQAVTAMHRGRVAGPLLIENFVPYSAVVMRRACLERTGCFDESLSMGFDYDLWLRLSAHYQFDFVPRATFRYRVWSGQLSRNYRKRWQVAIQTTQRFLDNHPDAVEAAVVREAWAHTYVGRGDSTLWQEQDRTAAFRDYLRALQYVPWYWPAWRALARGLITTRAP
ncbi:MAG: glycosyltransferase [Proteobacteria bacterium]|nr:glycosyltransferase [Pseudomonadota bacterium]